MALQIIMVLSLFRVLDSLFTFFGLDTLFSLISQFFTTTSQILPVIYTYLGYVSYFIPISYLKPLLFISLGTIGLRSVMALLHLIKW